MDLTKRQQEIFDFIRKYSASYGYPPTVRDIGKAVGLASSSTVHAHLANLEKIGLLRRDPSKPRAIELLDRAMGSAVDSVRGSCARRACRCWARSRPARRCWRRRTSRTTIRARDSRRGRRRVSTADRGDSMKDAGILEGDYVVVRPQDTASDGEVVVALLGEEATVNQFFRESDHIVCSLRTKRSNRSAARRSRCSVGRSSCSGRIESRAEVRVNEPFGRRAGRRG